MVRSFAEGICRSTSWCVVYGPETLANFFHTWYSPNFILCFCPLSSGQYRAHLVFPCSCQIRIMLMTLYSNSRNFLKQRSQKLCTQGTMLPSGDFQLNYVKYITHSFLLINLIFTTNTRSKWHHHSYNYKLFSVMFWYNGQPKQCGKLTSTPVNIATTCTFCSHSICQKSSTVLDSGPCAAMYHHVSPFTFIWKIFKCQFDA